MHRSGHPGYDDDSQYPSDDEEAYGPAVCVFASIEGVATCGLHKQALYHDGKREVWRCPASNALFAFGADFGQRSSGRATRQPPSRFVAVDPVDGEGTDGLRATEILRLEALLAAQAAQVETVRQENETLKKDLEESLHCGVLQAVLDAIAGTLDPSTQIADHPNVKFAQMQRLDLLQRANWHPIATIPTDGTRVLVWNGYRRSYGYRASYADGSGGWHRQNLIGEPVGFRDADPDTHWMPLASPPAQETEEPRTSVRGRSSRSTERRKGSTRAK